MAAKKGGRGGLSVEKSQGLATAVSAILSGNTVLGKQSQSGVAERMRSIGKDRTWTQVSVGRVASWTPDARNGGGGSLAFAEDLARAFDLKVEALFEGRVARAHSPEEAEHLIAMRGEPTLSGYQPAVIDGAWRALQALGASMEHVSVTDMVLACEFAKRHVGGADAEQAIADERRSHVGAISRKQQT